MNVWLSGTSERIGEILEVLSLIVDEEPQSAESVRQSRLRATHKVADKRGIAERTVADKCWRGLNLDSILDFDSHISEWLFDDNMKLMHRLRSRVVSSSRVADLAAIERFFDNADLIHESDLFDDNKAEDDPRERVPASILRRRGQQQFRLKLLDRYKGRCAITDCDANAALEAAHILPYSEGGRHTTDNGLLLRADIHTLFDLGLLFVDPKTKEVVLAPVLQDTAYGEELKDVKLNEPYPSEENLKLHQEASWQRWKDA